MRSRCRTTTRALVLGVLMLLGLPGLVGCSALHDSAAAAKPTSSPVQVFDRSGQRQADFGSPNGNINCRFSASTDSNPSGTVRCEIVVKNWQAPVKPSTCEVNWGLGLTLDGRADVLCASDVIQLAPDPTHLPYGTSIRFTPFTCTSQPTGIDCENTVTNAGFMIGRERYVLRNP